MKEWVKVAHKKDMFMGRQKEATYFLEHPLFVIRIQQVKFRVLFYLP